MKILHLTLKKKWFDMIASGDKKEEYREVKPYWVKRLTNPQCHKVGTLELIRLLHKKESFRSDFKAVQFKNGYSKDAPTVLVELKEIHYGYPAMIEWIEEGYSNWYFCLVLGDILQQTIPASSDNTLTNTNE